MGFYLNKTSQVLILRQFLLSFCSTNNFVMYPQANANQMGVVKPTYMAQQQAYGAGAVPSKQQQQQHMQPRQQQMQPRQQQQQQQQMQMQIRQPQQPQQPVVQPKQPHHPQVFVANFPYTKTESDFVFTRELLRFVD